MAKNKDISLPLSLAVKVELFKRGCFDFITCKDGKRSRRRREIMDGCRMVALYVSCLSGDKVVYRP